MTLPERREVARRARLLSSSSASSSPLVSAQAIAVNARAVAWTLRSPPRPFHCHSWRERVQALGVGTVVGRRGYAFERRRRRRALHGRHPSAVPRGGPRALRPPPRPRVGHAAPRPSAGARRRAPRGRRRPTRWRWRASAGRSPAPGRTDKTEPGFRPSGLPRECPSTPSPASISGPSGSRNGLVSTARRVFRLRVRELKSAAREGVRVQVPEGPHDHDPRFVAAARRALARLPIFDWVAQPRTMDTFAVRSVWRSCRRRRAG